MSDDHAEPTLIMPFVACVSAGGPYDDDAFVAGYRLGAFEQQLRSAGTEAQAWLFTVEKQLVPQMDLVAMRHGYVMRSGPWPECSDEWAFVVLTRPELGTERP